MHAGLRTSDFGLRTSELGLPSGFDIRDSAFYQPRTLSRDVRTRGRLPFEECVRIGLALTSALAHLHRHGLVHRDVKPSNIIFVDGVPKLADVGLVAASNEARSFVGTPGYIPPEGPGTPEADVYSLGIVLYEIATGKSPHEFPEPGSRIETDPDRARWVEFNAVIHRACQADVRRRYRSAGAMQADLALRLTDWSAGSVVMVGWATAWAQASTPARPLSVRAFI